MRQTKIITSIGEITKTIKDFENVLKLGSNVARINFSHGNGEEHASKVKLVQQAAKNLNQPWPLLLDTKGPEIRTHKFKEGEAFIEIDSKVDIYLQKEVLGDSNKFSITYKNLWKDIKTNDLILIDDGYLSLKVLNITKEKITTQAINSRVIADRRGVNIPGREIKIDFLSKKDMDDITWGCTQPFDYIALSFVQKAGDVKKVREILDNLNRKDIKIISKLESQSAINNFTEILNASDAIMVARGDLGVEIDPALVPGLQKRWIRECNKLGKPIIVATQMLESMTSNPFPTRAEVSDVYNAIEDATSAIMLSGETAKGKFYKESTKMMAHIAQIGEYEFDSARYFNRINRDGVVTIYDKICKTIFRKTNQNEINHIFVNSTQPKLIEMISRTKPQALIHPICNSWRALHKFGINFGIYPVYSKTVITQKSIDFFKKNIDSNNKDHKEKILYVNDKEIIEIII